MLMNSDVFIVPRKAVSRSKAIMVLVSERTYLILEVHIDMQNGL